MVYHLRVSTKPELLLITGQSMTDCIVRYACPPIFLFIAGKARSLRLGEANVGYSLTQYSN